MSWNVMIGTQKSRMRRRVIVLAGLLSLGSLGTGCAPSAPRSEEAATIRLALNWFPDTQHAGFYAAEVFEEFKQQGLSVEIIPGGPAAPIVQNVALKQVEFAVANADQILMARAQGAPIVAVLASMQTSPRCIMIHRESGIQSLGDLRDLTLARWERVRHLPSSCSRSSPWKMSRSFPTPAAWRCSSKTRGCAAGLCVQ